MNETTNQEVEKDAPEELGTDDLENASGGIKLPYQPGYPTPLPIDAV